MIFVILGRDTENASEVGKCYGKIVFQLLNSRFYHCRSQMMRASTLMSRWDMVPWHTAQLSRIVRGGSRRFAHFKKYYIGESSMSPFEQSLSQ